MSDRATQLATMTPEELRAEVARLDALLAAAPDPDLLPIAFHVSGAAHRGTARRVVRCATAGDYADRWMAQVGDTLVGQDGSRLAARPFEQISATLRERVAWPSLEEAAKAAGKASLKG